MKSELIGKYLDGKLQSIDKVLPYFEGSNHEKVLSIYQRTKGSLEHTCYILSFADLYSKGEKVLAIMLRKTTAENKYWSDLSEIKKLRLRLIGLSIKGTKKDTIDLVIESEMDDTSTSLRFGYGSSAKMAKDETSPFWENGIKILEGE